MTETLKELCIRLEHFETPEWAIKAILQKEILTPFVVDPCCGTGVLARAAYLTGCEVFAEDIHDWGYPGTNVRDFFSCDHDLENLTVLMNPPFTLACQFVLHALKRGARKVICFQRFAWWESRARKEFWENNPPARVYICGDRAPCWRHDIPADERNSSSPTAHAWFVWEQGAPQGTLLDHVWRAQ